MPAPRHSRRTRELLKAAAVAIGVLLAAAVLVVVLNPSAIAMRFKDHLLPKVSQELGREVKVAHVSVSLIPRPAVELRDVTIAGGEGEPTFLTAAAAEATLEFWPLLRSFGQDVRLRGVTLSSPKIVMVRRADGSWSVEDLGSGTAGEGGGSGQTQLSISRLSVRDGELTIEDRSGGGAVTGVALTDIDALARHFEFCAPLSVQLKAALGGGGQNVSAVVELDHLPASWEGLAPEQWPRLSGSLALNGAPLSALRDYLPEGLNEIMTAGAVNFRGELGTREDHAWTVGGLLSTAELSLRGQPAEATAQVLAAVKPAEDGQWDLKLESLRLQGPGVGLT
ncbi:MAG: AsmA family protein, partial [Myxococcales bacterium]